MAGHCTNLFFQFKKKRRLSSKKKRGLQKSSIFALSPYAFGEKTLSSKSKASLQKPLVFDKAKLFELP